MGFSPSGRAHIGKPESEVHEEIPRRNRGIRREKIKLKTLSRLTLSVGNRSEEEADEVRRKNLQGQENVSYVASLDIETGNALSGRETTMNKDQATPWRRSYMAKV